MRTQMMLKCNVCLGLVLVLLSFHAPSATGTSWWEKVDETVLAEVNKESCEFLVTLSVQADLSHAASLTSKWEKGHYTVMTLKSVAARTQTPVVNALAATGVTYRTFWIANMIWVRGDGAVLEMLASRDDVARILANPRIRIPSSQAKPPVERDEGFKSVEWNISHVNGPAVWSGGNIGQDAVVGGIDTGYEWDHPALMEQYRGWDGITTDHDYNWHDAIHVGGGDCGANSPEPCDDNGHGSHTMGVMVGDDGGANQIGLAPGARWIGCRCMDQGYGTPATFIECLEWMVAPYPLGGGSDEGDPSLAPDVINNSWSCLPSVGCAWDTLLPVIENVRAAGIVVVASAGGNGPDCSSVLYPPEIYEASFTVGATNSTDIVASFSGRGPVLVDGSGRLKPDVCAPGVAVRSSVLNGTYAFYSGASMAAPHVAGLVALVVTANPGLAGDVDQLELIITSSAVPLTSNQCGDGDDVPNNVYGHGRIDALAACTRAVVGVDEVTPGPDPTPASLRLLPNIPNPFNPVTTIAFELPEPSHVHLHIYDVSGRLVRVLLDGNYLGASRHETIWYGEDESGHAVAAGIYFCRLDANGHALTQRLALIK